jgi:hypothetical protein
MILYIAIRFLDSVITSKKVELAPLAVRYAFFFLYEELLLYEYAMLQESCTSLPNTSRTLLHSFSYRGR